MFMMQGLRDMSFVFVFTGNYHLRTGKWMAIPVLAYIFPGIHWRADIGYVAYGAAQDNKEWVRSDGSYRAQIICSYVYVMNFKSYIFFGG